MVFIVEKRFLRNGFDPAGCQVTPSDNLTVEVILQSELWTAPEKIIDFTISVQRTSDNVCVKKYRNQNCCLKAYTTYTWATLPFTLPAGSYFISIYQWTNYDCSSGFWCNDYFTVPEVAC